MTFADIDNTKQTDKLSMELRNFEKYIFKLVLVPLLDKAWGLTPSHRVHLGLPCRACRLMEMMIVYYLIPLGT